MNSIKVELKYETTANLKEKLSPKNGNTQYTWKEIRNALVEINLHHIEMEKINGPRFDLCNECT